MTTDQMTPGELRRVGELLTAVIRDEFPSSWTLAKIVTLSTTSSEEDAELVSRFAALINDEPPGHDDVADYDGRTTVKGEVGTITGPPIVGTNDTTNAGPAVLAEGQKPPLPWLYDAGGRVPEDEVRRLVETYDPNAGQTDDAEAVKVLTEVLEGWRQNQLNHVELEVMVTDILVDLPRRGWHLARIGETVRLEDCDILVGIEWQRATGEGFIPGQIYRVRER